MKLQTKEDFRHLVEIAKKYGWILDSKAIVQNAIAKGWIKPNEPKKRNQP